MNEKHINEYTKDVKQRGLTKSVLKNSSLSFKQGLKAEISLGSNDYTKETTNSSNVAGSNIKATENNVNI